MSITEQVNNYLKKNRESSVDEAIRLIERFCIEKNTQLNEISKIKNEWRIYKSDVRLGLYKKNLPNNLKNIQDKIFSISRKLEPYQENFTNFYTIGKPKPKIFVSFNNQDKDKVDIIESHIGNSFVDLIRFDKDFNGSKNIEDSINKSIKATKATLLIVSFQSLSSAWVGTEAHISLISEELLNRKLFVCSVDNSLFEPSIIRKITLELIRKNNIFDDEIKERRNINNTDDDIETFDIDDDRHRIIIHKSSFLNTVKELKKKPNYLLFGENIKTEIEKLIKDIKEII